LQFKVLLLALIPAAMLQVFAVTELSAAIAGPRHKRSDQGRRAKSRYFFVVSAHAAAVPPAGAPPL
jgi:hypothetical protein